MKDSEKDLGKCFDTDFDFLNEYDFLKEISAIIIFIAGYSYFSKKIDEN